MKAEVSGYVAPGFEKVRRAFQENFDLRNDLGAACCIYKHGEKIVDLWGGVRDKKTGAPWQEDTMVIVWSATKGLSAMTLAIAHSRGWLNYDERVAAYWPEFAQNSKDQITVRLLLAHQAGLHAFHQRVDRDTVSNLDRLAIICAQEKPEWQAGERQSYHALTLGFFENELIRRVDPKRRSLGQFFQEEIATPLGIDFFIRLPESIPNSRLAVLDQSLIRTLFSLPAQLALASLNPRSALFRALVVNPGTQICLDRGTIYSRSLEVPSGGGVGTARAIARAYDAFANGSKDIGLCAETLQLLMAPALPPKNGFFDEALRGEVQFSLGFMKPSNGWPFGHDGAFGSPGAGGALGYADPRAGVSYAYVTNRMGRSDGDPRDVALRTALNSVLSL